MSVPLICTIANNTQAVYEDTLNHLHNAIDRQGKLGFTHLLNTTVSVHMYLYDNTGTYCELPSFSCDNPSYECNQVHSPVQQLGTFSHIPTIDNNTDNMYSRLSEVHCRPPLAGHDYEVVEEVRREKEKSPEN